MRQTAGEIRSQNLVDVTADLGNNMNARRKQRSLQRPRHGPADEHIDGGGLDVAHAGRKRLAGQQNLAAGRWFLAVNVHDHQPQRNVQHRRNSTFVCRDRETHGRQIRQSLYRAGQSRQNNDK